jgi:shikimate dehydrogenase
VHPPGPGLRLTAASGATRLTGVIGWPVRHSASPRIHNAAFAHVGLDWVHLALPVEPGAARPAIEGADALGMEGLSVTMPHKAAVAACLGRLTDDAVALGAVNCVYRDGPSMVGDNTDGGGFVDSLRNDEGLDPGGLRCVVVGAGSAARAVVRALASAGASRVVVCARRPEAAAGAAAHAGPAGSTAALEGESDSDVPGSDLPACDLIVNATPVGMGDDDRVPFDPSRCAPGTVVADLVYHPAETPLLRAAAAHGLRTVGGIGMLVHQAARAFSLWTGVDAPIEVMAAAARAR